MEIEIGKSGENVLVVVRYDDGETPRAYTIAEIRDWVSGSELGEDIGERFSRASILDAILERIELDTIQPK